MSAFYSCPIIAFISHFYVSDIFLGARWVLRRRSSNSSPGSRGRTNQKSPRDTSSTAARPLRDLRADPQGGNKVGGRLSQRGHGHGSADPP
eukprot:2375087-Pyramimonas_sp.AAC.1